MFTFHTRGSLPCFRVSCKIILVLAKKSHTNVIVRAKDGCNPQCSSTLIKSRTMKKLQCKQKTFGGTGRLGTKKVQLNHTPAFSDS